MALSRFIRSAEVDSWLEGSVVTVPLVHATDVVSAAALRVEGIDVERDTTGVCQGCYLSDEVWKPLTGSVAVSVAARIVNPLRVKNMGHVRVELFEVVAKSAKEVRRDLLDRGHDAVIAEESWGGGGRVYVLLRDGVGRVIVD